LVRRLMRELRWQIVALAAQLIAHAPHRLTH
jgi:hypothetical protein